jgi:hypothetical protein
MSFLQATTSIGGGAALLGMGGMLRFIPEPKSRNPTVFSSILDAGSAVAQRIGGAFGGLDTGLQQLLSEQARLQVQMQMVSLVSNTMKSEHDMQMAAIRNLRVD